MSAYIKLSTLEYPRHEGDIRIEYPDIREDQTGSTFPCPDTYALVTWVDNPTVRHDERYYEGLPELVDGTWRMTWLVRPATQEEQDALINDLDAPGSTPDVIE